MTWSSQHFPEDIPGSDVESSLIGERRLFLTGRTGVGGLSSGKMGAVLSGVRNIFQSSLYKRTQVSQLQNLVHLDFLRESNSFLINRFIKFLLYAFSHGLMG